jgi:CBS domain containing-hemolysin-like protein
MSDLTKQIPQKRQRRAGLCGHGAGIFALVALAIALAAWFWMTRQPPAPQTMSVTLPQGVLITAVIASIGALIAELRAMTVWEMVETAAELSIPAIVGLFGMIWRIIAFIGAAILGLLGLSS